MKTSVQRGVERLVTAAEMRFIEDQAFSSGKISSFEAMERAGRAVVDAILRRFCTGEAASALVLAGPGNNGGDGYVIARRLHQIGWSVTVLAVGNPARLGQDAAEMQRQWLSLGEIGDLYEASIGSPDFVIDAIFGIGLSRPVDDRLAAQFTRITALRPRLRVAVDIPSGLETDTGAILNSVLPADLTVTFHSLKLVHRLRADLCGVIEVAEIGL